MNSTDNTPTGAAGGTGQAANGQGDKANGSLRQPPEFVLNEVRLLLDKLTAPETKSDFDTASRADPGSIENTIRGRPSSPVATWTWRNKQERDHQQVANGDVGKIGYQTDIDSYFRLDSATGPVWKPVPNPDASSAPFELSTGASDAVAFHDFYRLQIAFEDVWAELIDESMHTTAQAFYAKWDALVNEGMGGEQYTSEFDLLTSSIGGAKPFVQGMPALSVSDPQILATYRFTVSLMLTSSLDVIAQVQGKASASFKSAFGLDLQNIQAELATALSWFGAFPSGPGADSKPITDSLDAALQIIVTLKSKLSQGAAARTAAFSTIPREDIGGLDQLQNFLNDVRVILGLPVVTTKNTDLSNGAKDTVVALGKLIETLSNQQATFSSNVKQEVTDGDQPKTITDTLYSSLAALNSTIASIKYLIVACKSVDPSIVTDIQGVSNLLDNLSKSVQEMYGESAKELNAGGDDNNPPQVLSKFTTDRQAEVLSDLAALNAKVISLKPASGNAGSSDSPDNSVASDLNFPELETLFNRLSNMLKERYRFDVFAPASINYGLLLNYRQQWKPQSYQVGNLTATIPLAPGETRRYTSKTVVKKSRSAKELDESLRSNKEDKSETQRVDAEIFNNANEKTDFKANASGSFKIGVYNIDADTHFGKDQGVESKNTKRNLRECVTKSAQEYRNEHRMEVTTEGSREDETTSYREIRNPNDELTVTYLFYELQRRYLVSESLHRATPVILVANDVPAPHEVDQAWLVRYDWILKRAILDDSFLPALEYLATDYTGEETALIILELAVQHQKSVVDKLSQQVMLANQSLNAATVGLTQAEDASVNDQRNAEYGKFIKAFFDPLGVGQVGNMDNGTSNRARLEFGNQALERAQAKANDLTSQMKTELTALQTATDKYTAAATRHYGMLAEIDRLRLHVKDNIIHYMQAIWSHEPPDQRYFRLYNLDAPVFEHNTTVEAKSVAAELELQTSAKGLLAFADTSSMTYTVRLPTPTLSNDTKKLHQIADIDNLIGFKGNYMIFPLTDFDNYMVWYLIHNFIHFDDPAGPFVSDPDLDADIGVDRLKTAMENINAKDSDSFATNADKFEDVMVRLLSNEAEQMVIVPSDQLYIEALPGTHPLLEDFKLIHRAIDVKKVQAEVRHLELENLRLAARLASGEYGDPDIEKVVVVGDNKNVTVDAGQ